MKITDEIVNQCNQDKISYMRFSKSMSESCAFRDVGNTVSATIRVIYVDCLFQDLSVVHFQRSRYRTLLIDFINHEQIDIVGT